jgi:hypothetical protein
MEVGDMALTDKKLQGYGISQLGLRFTVLSVIKCNR